MRNKLITEGVRYIPSEDRFVFDFNTNTDDCIIWFDTTGLKPVEIGINEVYFFGYKFIESDYVNSKIRTKFFNEIRYSKDLEISEDKRKFIINALRKLHKEINVYNIDVIIRPESRSKLNTYMLGLLGTTTNIPCKLSIEMVKKTSK